MQASATVAKAVAIQEPMKLTYPHVPPYKMVGEYMTSKLELRHLHRAVEWDKARQGPECLLVKVQRDFARSEEKLARKREEAKGSRKELDEQWEDLREKERRLKDNFIRFNKFVRENQKKRDRAAVALAENTDYKRDLDAQFEEMMAGKIKLMSYKNEMNENINQMRIYEDYMRKVVDIANLEFKDVQDLVSRYESLMMAKNELAMRQERDLASLESAKSNFNRMTEEYMFVLLGLNNTFTSLNSRYQKAVVKSRKWETIVTDIRDASFKKFCELTQVKNCLWGIYKLMCSRKNVPADLDESDYDGQLLFIKKSLLELMKVREASKLVNKKSKSSSLLVTGLKTKTKK